ncbi:MAG: Eco29kI family restriction endonuclease [Phycisphaerae bacterium]|nr:Eco29kI family restriction endonuclease [Phycisphaerae bacterium]
MTTEFDPVKVQETLRELLACLPDDGADVAGVSAGQGRKLRRDLLAAISRMEKLCAALDPVRQPEVVFDPSQPEIVGKLIALTLLEQARHGLGQVGKFYGSGVYAIYYRGGFSAYGPIRGKDTPIYVGKADPKSPDAKSATDQGLTLWRRLADHLKSITRAENLEVADFDCRYLVVKSAWQITAERYLIDRFKPVWNNEIGVCFGFGKHGDDPKTRSNKRSPWDTVHPGRAWAMSEGNVPGKLAADKILGLIREHFLKNPPKE